MQLYPNLNAAIFPGPARTRTSRYLKSSPPGAGTTFSVPERWTRPDAFVKTVQAKCYRAGLTEATDPRSRPKADEHLIEWAADPRSIRCNLCQLRTHGGKAPGVACANAPTAEAHALGLLERSYVARTMRRPQVDRKSYLDS